MALGEPNPFVLGSANLFQDWIANTGRVRMAREAAALGCCCAIALWYEEEFCTKRTNSRGVLHAVRRVNLRLFLDRAGQDVVVLIATSFGRCFTSSSRPS